MCKLVLCFFLLIGSLNSFAQIPTIQWQHSYGDSGDEEGYSIKAISEEGYIVAGYTDSNSGIVVNNNGNRDLWIFELDSIGNLLWNSCYGGLGTEKGFSITKSIDKGFVAVGYAGSNTGMVAGCHGGLDFWVVKTDSLGIFQWQKCIGGISIEQAHCIIATVDSGYLVTGTTDSYGNGGDDMWVVKLDQVGNIEWSRALGGSDYEQGNACVQKANGNYLISGAAASINGDVTGNHSSTTDAWVVELNDTGGIVWNKCYGGSNLDNSYGIELTDDGGFLLSAFTRSSDGDVSQLLGVEDFWLVKCNSIGTIEWEKTYGGAYHESPRAIARRSNGEIVMAGVSTTDDGMVTGSHGSNDFWVICVDSMGNLLWTKCLGGTGSDFAYALDLTDEGDVVVAGTTESSNGDVTNNYGGKDVWVVKLSTSTVEVPEMERQLMDFTVFQKDDLLRVRFYSRRNIPLYFQIFDYNGQLLHEQSIDIHEGINLLDLAPAMKSTGLYVLSVNGMGLNLSKVFQFIKE